MFKSFFYFYFWCLFQRWKLSPYLPEGRMCYVFNRTFDDYWFLSRLLRNSYFNIMKVIGRCMLFDKNFFNSTSISRSCAVILDLLRYRRMWGRFGNRMKISDIVKWGLVKFKTVLYSSRQRGCSSNESLFLMVSKMQLKIFSLSLFRTKQIIYSS